MDNEFNFKSEAIKPINEFGDNNATQPAPQSQPDPQSQLESQFQSDPQSQPVSQFQPMSQSQPNLQPQMQSISPVPKTKNPNTLVYIIVALGVVALIAITVCIWLIVDKTKSPNIATTTNKTSSATTEEQEITAKTLGFFPKKIKNPADGVTYRLGVHRESNNNGIFGAYINTENTGVELYIYWEFIGAYYGIDTGGKTNRQLAHINFDQPIADIALGESGQTVGGDVLLFLMQDGTVEYMPIVKALTENRLESYGKMGGLENIIKFYRTDAIDSNGDFSGYITTLAQKTDGQIIDLQGFMRSATAMN